MSDLMMLWKSRVSAIVGIVRAGETEHREVANIAAQIGADYHGRFIIELLQNASDQAASGGLRDSSVTIIRTSELVAVANEGNPFNHAGLRSITSLGLSTKNPQDAIGNKGVGFKSVFQVSESPEIYSSPSPTRSYDDADGLMFKLSLTPFARPEFEDAARMMVAEQIAGLGTVDATLTVERMLEEVKAAAPFKFPLPLSLSDLASRVSEISDRPAGQTLVVLPLRQTPGTTKTVERAIDELFQESGAAILFLPSISTIRVVDRVRGFTRTITRRPSGCPRRINGFGELTTAVTAVQQDGAESQKAWRIMQRRIGVADVVSDEQASIEAERINVEARKLPGANWDTVHNSPIGVAVPLPKNVAPSGSLLLGVRGRVCIGLPTKDLTGTPAWVNAHFHGTISRTGIDLNDNSYNKTLFAEAVRLHDALVADLKADADIHIRRTATLVFERGEGPLADVLYAPDGQAKGEVILSVDTQTFQTPASTVLPDPADVDALLLMMPQTAGLSGFGLTIPEVALARHARALIESLVGAKTDSVRVASLLLGRSRQKVSIMEHSAHIRRQDGPEFWERFLTWVVGRFTPEQLSDQRLLPVGRDAIAKAAERVFLPPSPRRSGESLVDEDGVIAEIPTDLAQSLNFLDSTAVVVRKADARSLTELASKLAPDTGRGLVRSPRLDHLINDAVAPLMQELTDDEAGKQNGIRLLRQAVQWLWALSESGRERLTKDALRVPVVGASGAWAWVAPSTTYFGSGWLGTPFDSLLLEAYGHEPARLLVPCQQFSIDFGMRDEERDAWIGAFELLGISRSPKVVRPRPGSRPAPFVSVNYSELTIDSTTCPIQQAAKFWPSYLEATRHRGTRTASRQTFDFRSTTWIDGLEREASQPAIVKLILLNPGPYESETATFLERQYRQNDDSEVVSSLWAHAITANSWKVIPTQRGPVSPADAWLLDGQQRGLAQRRLALLNQVEAPYGTAERLLHGIGVTTLQNATVSRLLHAIAQLGEAIGGFDTETRITALALAEDLFWHLQVAYAKKPGALPDLKSFCFPLERNREAIGVRGDQISTVYFNDDPVRAGFIPGFSGAWIWPLDIRHAYKDMVTELRRQLGEASVTFTSLATVESQFVEDPILRRVGLLEWLSTRFPQHAVAGDLACLIAYTGRVETDPTKDDFRRTWRAFEKASMVFGTFPDNSPTPYFYDWTTGLLQVSAALTDAEKVEATWMLVGPSYRDTWSAYARELDRNRPAKFLMERRITLSQRENVENAINLSSTERFKHVRAAALALWFTQFGRQPAKLFEEEWNVNARSVRGICEWLGRADLADTFAASLGGSEENASLAIIRAAHIGSEQWQDARLALGMERWSFTNKVKIWNDTMTELVSILKTCVARAANASPTDLEPILRDSRLAVPTDEVAFKAEDEGEVLQAVLRQMEVVLNDNADIVGVDFVRRRLATVVSQAKETLSTVDLDDAPARDVRVYRDEDEGKRSRDAQARFDGLMTVAAALALKSGEQIRVEEVRSDSRVAILLTGWWANSFTVIAAIQRVLQAKAPETAQRMSDERVFRDPAPANELLGRFKELADLGRGGPPVPPKRKITLLGQEQTEDDAAKDLLRGTTGSIGQRLKEKAALHPLDLNLGRGDRRKVVLPSGKTKTRGGGGGGGGGSQENKRDRELAGLIGEAFIYEHFRIALPAFDEMAWRSWNRNAYGLEGEGDDSLGFDFSYRDIGNQLAGRLDRPLCCIEVKSSSGDGSEPFQMTTNEWEKARECRQTSDSVYIIMRVARVRDDPRITDVIIDPFGLYGAGQIAVASRDLWIHVGTRELARETPDRLLPVGTGTKNPCPELAAVSEEGTPDSG